MMKVNSLWSWSLFIKLFVWFVFVSDKYSWQWFLFLNPTILISNNIFCSDFILKGMYNPLENFITSDRVSNMFFDSFHILGVSTIFLNLKRSILECPLFFIPTTVINDCLHIWRPILQHLTRYFELFCVLAFVWPFWP